MSEGDEKSVKKKKTTLTTDDVTKIVNIYLEYNDFIAKFNNLKTEDEKTNLVNKRKDENDENSKQKILLLLKNRSVEEVKKIEKKEREYNLDQENEGKKNLLPLNDYEKKVLSDLKIINARLNLFLNDSNV